MLSPYSLLPHVFGPRTRTQGRNGAEYGKMKSWRDEIQSLLQMRFIVVCLRESKSHFVTIDSRVLSVFMKEISPALGVSNKEIIGEDRDSYWQNIFDFKRPRPAKKRYSRGQSTTMGYTYV